MQTVSQEWKTNQKQTLVGESFVEISLDIADPDALADASSEDNGAVYISNTPQVVSEVDKNIVPYSTLEQNIWLLDGSRRVIPQSDFGECGYIGDVLGNEVGAFTDKIPIINIGFSKVHTNPIPAITITWGNAYDEFAEDFKITAYNGDTIVSEKDVVGNRDVKSVVEMDIVNYDRITISILKWCLPYRRARIEEIFVGMNKVYTKKDLFSYQHTQYACPVSSELPKAEISFSVNNLDNSYNPYNQQGLTKYLMERQEIKARYGFRLDDGNIEWIKGGTFYLSEWNAKQNGITAEFTARDLLEFMTTTYYKGVYNPNGTSLYDLAEQLFIEADLPLNADGSRKWVVDESLRNITTVAPLPVDTIANNLQLVANAAKCVLYQDREGIFHIAPITTDVTDYAVTLKNSYSKPEVELNKPIKQVNVSVHQYFDDENGELYNGSIVINGTMDIVLTYSAVAKNATTTISGGTLVSAEYYANACKLTITANGEVGIIVTGNKLNESSIEVPILVDVVGEVVTVDNPLITDYNRAFAVGTWMGEYMSHRQILSLNWRVDPRVDALDIITNENGYGSQSVRMTDITLTYNGAFKGSGEGRVR